MTDIIEKQDINKASQLLADLAMMTDLSKSVTVDGTRIEVSIPFTTAKVAQKVATVIAHSINGSKDMNNVRKEIKAEVGVLLKMGGGYKI